MDWVEALRACGAGKLIQAVERQIAAAKRTVTRIPGILHLLIHIDNQILRTGIDSFFKEKRQINAKTRPQLSPQVF
jgi:hypothetical protein